MTEYKNLKQGKASNAPKVKVHKNVFTFSATLLNGSRKDGMENHVGVWFSEEDKVLILKISDKPEGNFKTFKCTEVSLKAVLNDLGVEVPDGEYEPEVEEIKKLGKVLVIKL